MVCGWKFNIRVFNFVKKIEFSNFILDVVFIVLVLFVVGMIEGYGYDRDLFFGL